MVIRVFSLIRSYTDLFTVPVEAGRQAARHLIDCGKRAIAYLGGPEAHLDE
jgi:DNA-binding LacI/PurR family transcriptional regulator